MQKRLIPLLTLPLILVACGDTEQNQAAAPQTPPAAEAPAEMKAETATTGAEDKRTEVVDQAQKWAEETKKLGATAWDATKETASEVAEDGEKALDQTKQALTETYQATKEKTGEAIESAKQQGNELLESAKEKGSELLQPEQPAPEDSTKQGTTEI